MISKQLLAMLVCPLTKLSLAPAPEELIAQLNLRIGENGIVNRAGAKIEEPLTEGLLRSDGEVLYIVRDAIPIMLADEAIDVDQL